jgi:hypothetical protein
MPLVVLRAVQRDEDSVRSLEEPVSGLALLVLGPAERPQELGHPLDVGAGQGEEVELRRAHASG